MRDPRVITWTSIAAASIGVAAILLILALPPRSGTSVSDTKVSAPKEADPEDVHYSIYSGRGFFDEAYTAAGAPLLSPDDAAKTIAAIVPHHLFVKDRIAALFESLEGQKFDTVVIVGPDHFGAIHGVAALSGEAWETPYGRLEPDADIIKSLSNNGVTAQEQPFLKEHAVTGLVAFVKKSLPGVKFVPILLAHDCPNETVDRLAATLAEQGRAKRILVIASVDFSHEVNASTADKQDAASVAVIKSFAWNKTAGLKLDSPASIRLAMKYAAAMSATDVRDLAATQSSRLLGHPNEPGTSHRVMSFETPASR